MAVLVGQVIFRVDGVVPPPEPPVVELAGLITMEHAAVAVPLEDMTWAV